MKHMIANYNYTTYHRSELISGKYVREHTDDSSVGNGLDTSVGAVRDVGHGPYGIHRGIHIGVLLQGYKEKWMDTTTKR